MTLTLPADLLAACASAPAPAQVLALRQAMAALGPVPLRRRPEFDGLALPTLPDAVPGRIASDGGRAWLVLNAASGWRREAALRGLDAPLSGFEVMALMERLNDWVPEVRRAAEVRLAALSPVIAPALVAEVALAQGLRIEGFVRLSRVGRALWDGLLARADVRAALVQALLGAQGAGVQRVALRLLRDPALDAALTDLALRAAHPGLRAVALGAVLGGAMVWHAGWRIEKATQVALPDWRRRPLSVAVDADALALAAAGDRAAQVRKVLADGLTRLDPAQALPLAQRLAGDRNAAVRLRAAFFLGQRAA